MNEAPTCGNAGRGFIWIIGVNERLKTIAPQEDIEVQNWWGAVRKRFAEIAPDLTVLVVPVDLNQTVTALRFDTSRAPYLVTASGSAGVDREIPWREGNSTRSAHRREVLRIIVDEAGAPTLEAVSAYVEFSKSNLQSPAERVTAHGRVRLFAEAIIPVVLPEHRWTCRATFGSDETLLTMTARGPQHPVGISQSGMTGMSRGARSSMSPRAVSTFAGRTQLN